MSNYCLVIYTVLAIACGSAVAGDTAATLDEAEAYLTVNPARSIALLDQIADIDTLPPELAIRRYVLLLRAAVPTNDMPRLIQVLDILFNYQQHAYFQQHVTAITSALGIWLRRNNYLHDAQSSFACSYTHSTTERQRLTLTNSLALVARQLNETDKARTLFIAARQMAQQSGQLNVVAMAENNLGLLALDEGNITAAEPHFRAALAQYQAISQRAGQISAGINLLFYFVLQQDVLSFQRLYTPTANLTTNFPNEAKQALLFWLHSRFMQLQGQPVTAQMQQQLREDFQLLEDNQVKTLIQRYLAPPLAVDVKAAPALSRQSFNRPWFSSVLACNWPINSVTEQPRRQESEKKPG